MVHDSKSHQRTVRHTGLIWRSQQADCTLCDPSQGYLYANVVVLIILMPGVRDKDDDSGVHSYLGPCTNDLHSFTFSKCVAMNSENIELSCGDDFTGVRRMQMYG
jgi:hypothetical protein